MRIDTRIEKRCPNGSHKWKSDGRCHPNDEKEPSKRKRRQQQQSGTSDTPSSGNTVPEIVAWKPEQKKELKANIKTAYLESKKDDESQEEFDARKEQAKEARRAINKMRDEHHGRIPKMKVPVFRMVYNEETGEYVKSTKKGQGILFDGNTTTKQAYTVETTDENGNTVRDYTPERRKLHEEIVEEIMKNFTKPPEGQKPRIIVMGGGSGSGKSSMNNYLKEKGWDFAKVDPDAIMTDYLPEWDLLSKQNILQSAFLGHDEASDIAKTLYKTLVKNGYDIIYDGTFSSDSAVNKVFGPLKDTEYDYEVHHIGMDIDVDKGLESCHGRFVAVGREVPDDVVKKTNQGYYKMFHNEDVMDRFDSVRVFHRDGDEITTVMTKEKGKGMNIENEGIWNSRNKKSEKSIGGRAMSRYDTRTRDRSGQVRKADPDNAVTNLLKALNQIDDLIPDLEKISKEVEDAYQSLPSDIQPKAYYLKTLAFETVANAYQMLDDIDPILEELEGMGYEIIL